MQKEEKKKVLSLAEKLMVERARREVNVLSISQQQEMKQIISGKSEISMRSIERFNSALDIYPEYAAFWIVNPETKQAEPVHIRRLIKELTDMFQEKNIKAFNRHKLVQNWPYRAAVCQLGYFPLAMKFQVLEYLKLVETSDLPFFRPLQKELERMRRTKRKTSSGSEIKLEKKKTAGVFFYEHPVTLPNMKTIETPLTLTQIVTEPESLERKQKRFRAGVVENNWFLASRGQEASSCVEKSAYPQGWKEAKFAVITSSSPLKQDDDDDENISSGCRSSMVPTKTSSFSLIRNVSANKSEPQSNKH
jgi:hypothetical protein